MMKWGSLNLFALLLSLVLNAGILMWGFSLYQAQSLQLSQAAGSDQSSMVFTLEVVASESASADHRTLKTAQDLMADLDVVADSAVDPHLFVTDNFPQPSAEKAVIATMEKQAQQIMAPEERALMKTQETRHKPAVVKDGETEKPIVSQTFEAIAPSEIPTSTLASTSTSTSAQKISETKGHLEALVETKARSGDQFAADLAASIHSQIEGCYPESSKRRGEEGVVVLQIVKNQYQLAVSVIKSSGFRRLDRCAISAVEKLLPSINFEEVPVSGINLKPIRFQLR